MKYMCCTVCFALLLGGIAGCSSPNGSKNSSSEFADIPWLDTLAMDSATLVPILEQSTGMVKYSTMYSWIKSSVRDTLSISSRKKLLNELTAISNDTLDTWLRDSRWVPHIARALFDPDSTVRDAAFAILKDDVTRKDLRTSKEILIHAPLDSFQIRQLWIRIVPEGAEKDSLQQAWEAREYSWSDRAGIGDSIAASLLMPYAFPDSAAYFSGYQLNPYMEGMQASTALYYNYLAGIEGLRGYYGQDLLDTLEVQMERNRSFYWGSGIWETFAWRVLQKYMRQHDEDTLLSRGIAWISNHAPINQEDNVLKGVGLTARQFYDHYDSVLQRDWHIALPVPSDTQTVLLRKDLDTLPDILIGKAAPL